MRQSTGAKAMGFAALYPSYELGPFSYEMAHHGHLEAATNYFFDLSKILLAVRNPAAPRDERFVVGTARNYAADILSGETLMTFRAESHSWGTRWNKFATAPPATFSCSRWTNPSDRTVWRNEAGTTTECLRASILGVAE
jgi:hypothetical protein